MRTLVVIIASFVATSVGLADPGIRTDLAPFLRPDQPTAAVSDRRVGEPIDLSRADQRRNAMHEAGHVMADAYCFGRKYVEKVYVTVKSGDGYGGTIEVGFANAMTTEQMRCEAVAYLAGRAADEIINGAPDAGSVGDIEAANNLVRRLHRATGLGSSLVIDMRCQERPEQRAALERDMKLIYECSRAIVKANRRQIVALANLVVAQPVKDGKRTVGTKRLQRFLRKHPPSRPKLDPITRLDPCAFDSL